jgi:O-succinylbenzoic acid--CoA ligase
MLFQSDKMDSLDLKIDQFLEDRFRFSEDWVQGIDHDRFSKTFNFRVHQLRSKALLPTLPLKVLVLESDPAVFLGSFCAACAIGCDLFLGNPNWVEAEFQQVLALIQPDVIWTQDGDRSLDILSLPSCAEKRVGGLGFPNSPTASYHLPLHIMIPTGGSSGKIRFAIHTWDTLMASVQGFTDYFQVDRVNSFCILPLYHVSGLMQFLRSLTTGGQLWIRPSKTLAQWIELSEFKLYPDRWFISLVPTQLHRLLNRDRASAWLAQFETVLLGGAPAWPALLEQARTRRIRLAPTYGMTETASQVATLKPDEFLAGNQSDGQVLPHAKLDILSATAGESGKIQIQSSALFLGYYLGSSNLASEVQCDRFISDDLGYFDRAGYLHIVGRDSDKIITGGENVFPAEIEAAILASNRVLDVCTIGIPDPEWGQAIVAVYVPKSEEITSNLLSDFLAQKLAKYKQPKYWLEVENLPRTEQGKIDQKAIQQWAIERLEIQDL